LLLCRSGDGGDHELGDVSRHPSASSSDTYSGVFKLRFPTPGQYKLFVINSASKQVLSSVHSLQVTLCGDSVIPADLQLQTKFDNMEEEKKKPPRPLLRHAGVLAVSGRHAVLVPQTELPPLSSGGGSFSISLWINLLDSAPVQGHFRAFFYKGDGKERNRTPSAWLLPTSNRLAIRATTADSPDLGADTTLSLPLSRWTHVCFVFDNSTLLSDGGGFKIVTYVDGQLDISIGYSVGVLANNFSLSLFKDISHDGPRSLVADLAVWDSPLTEAQVRHLAAGSASSSHARWTQPVDLALDLMAGLGEAAGGRGRGGGGVSGSTEQEQEQEQEDRELLFGTRHDFDLLLDSLPAPSTTPAASAPLDHLLAEAARAVADCAAPSVRLDLYAEAAVLGELAAFTHHLPCICLACTWRDIAPLRSHSTIPSPL
jgi:hypothetical protein